MTRWKTSPLPLNIPPDKLGHLLGGIAISETVGLAFAPLSVIWAAGAGAIVACFAGALKEWLDRRSALGTPDFWDFVWTCAGGFVGFAAVLWGCG